MFCFYCRRDNRDIHSFPTRRSSDLEAVVEALPNERLDTLNVMRSDVGPHLDHDRAPVRQLQSQRVRPRSEEHTSELQSLEHLVCRLLLDKKKKLQQTSKKTPTRDTF